MSPSLLSSLNLAIRKDLATLLSIAVLLSLSVESQLSKGCPAAD